MRIDCANEDAPELWNTLLEVGRDEGLIPCGLGARDTLRMEAAMPLYGHELNDERTPKESGIGFFCKMDKPDFIGKAAIEAKGAPTIKRVGLEDYRQRNRKRALRCVCEGREGGYGYFRYALSLHRTGDRHGLSAQRTLGGWSAGADRCERQNDRCRSGEAALL